MKLVLGLACVAFVGMGCQQADAPLTEQEQTTEHPLAGLYTPGSEIGVTEEARLAAQAAMAGRGGLTAEQSALQMAIQMAGDSDHCTGATGSPGVAGSLLAEFTTAKYGGKYTPKNCGVVWIEDAAGAYIATPMIWARLRTRPLFWWQTLRCSADEPDVIASATLDDHTKPHTAMWDGKDLKGNIVPDGMYVLNIEVTEDEANVGRRTEYPFMKGPMAQSQTPADTECVHGLKMTYTPGPSTPSTNPITGG